MPLERGQLDKNCFHRSVRSLRIVLPQRKGMSSVHADEAAGITSEKDEKPKGRKGRGLKGKGLALKSQQVANPKGEREKGCSSGIAAMTYSQASPT